MARFFSILHQIWATKTLRNKILFTLFILMIFRLAAHITVPGADVDQIRQMLELQAANSGGGSALSVFSLLTGGAMERFSIVLMGLTPYINASIILQLLGVIVPSIENLKKEGEAGQKKISQWTRLLTIPLAFVQSYGMMFLINQLGGGGPNSIVDMSDLAVVIPMMITVTAGTVFMMWLGELITEKGIGNGISLLIFAGIVAIVPTQIAGAFQSASILVNLMLVLATVLLTVFVVYVAEGDRRIPVVYANRKSGQQMRSFLPLKVNQGGMIPIIFAISILSMPSIVAQFMVNSDSETMRSVADFILKFLDPSSPTVGYNAIYALLIIGFTFFYVSIVFDPKKVAENIQKRGGFVPGYRPGAETENFIGGVSDRLVFWGALFLAFVAVAPVAFEKLLSGGTNSIAMFIGGAGIIIVVGVVLDIIRRINSQLVMHDYDKL